MTLQERIQRAGTLSYQNRFLRPKRLGICSISQEVRDKAAALIAEHAAYDECIKLLNAEAATSEDPVALRLRGSAYGFTGQFGAAYSDFAAAEALLLREQSILSSNRAAFLLEEAACLDADDLDQERSIAAQGKVEEAVIAARKALEQDDSYYLPWVNLCASLAVADESLDLVFGVLNQAITSQSSVVATQEFRGHLLNDAMLAGVRADRRFEQIAFLLAANS